ncbi:MAG: hypothetical protein ACLFMO_00400 [Eubacteriales bacterium]
MGQIESYIEILIDSLIQKKALLLKLNKETKKQAKIANKDEFKLIEFEETIKEKEKLLKQVELLDNGFNGIYERVRHDLINSKEQYKDKIIEFKKIINEISELSITIQVAEERNKNSIEKQLSKYKKEVKQFKQNKKSVTSYYKSMSKTHKGESYFVDRKN